MKKVLLFVPKFLDYDMQIKHELKKFGYSTDIVYENIDAYNTAFKTICTLLPNIKCKLATKIYEKQTDQLTNDYEYVLIIRGSMITNKYLYKLKEQFSIAKFLMYQWDSLAFNKNALGISDMFDGLFTFDMNDANKYGWNYRPLFYDESRVNTKLERDIDICYICSAHSQRIKILERIKTECEKKQFSLFHYLYAIKRSYFLHKYVLNDKLFRKFADDVYTVPLSSEDTNDIYERSKVIIDYTYPGQNGLTMRTIESIGHRCKLITNNRNIEKCDFYNPYNIFIYSDCDVRIPSDFVNSSYEPIKPEVYIKYSLESWVKEVFGFEDNYVDSKDK